MTSYAGILVSLEDLNQPKKSDLATIHVHYPSLFHVNEVAKYHVYSTFEFLDCIPPSTINTRGSTLYNLQGECPFVSFLTNSIRCENGVLSFQRIIDNTHRKIEGHICLH